MKKLKILGITLLIPVITIGTIGLASCSGAAVQPPVEPPVEPPVVVPPTLIEKKVHLIVPGLAGSSGWVWLLVKDVEYVKLIKSTYPSMPNVECLEYSLKFKNDNTIHELWTTDIEVAVAYNNWVEASSE